MDIFQITMTHEVMYESDYGSLILSLNYLKDKGKIIDFSRHNFNKYNLLFFAVKDMSEVIDQIEDVFKKNKVIAFGTKKIFGDL